MGKRQHKQRKIQDRNGIYTFLRHYVDWSLFQAYRHITYLGLEKIPQDAAVILAPNHTNALMDALVILSMDRLPKVFVARADIFRNPRIAAFLHFLKIMPIMRIRDGVEEVKKNQEIIDRSVDVLNDGIPFCILPEGTHRALHSLLPLSKGIFRIALQAQEGLAGQRDVYIVPVGIEYGNYFRFRSTVLVQIGDPINVRRFTEEHPGMEHPELMNRMKELLTERMRSLILYIPDDEWYEATHEICALAVNRAIRQLTAEEAGHEPLTIRLEANRRIVETVTRLRKASPEQAGKIRRLAEDIRKERLEKGISLASLTLRHPVRNRILPALVILAALPYLLVCTIATSPVTGATVLILKRMKDRAFDNSVRFVLTLVLWPLLMLVYGSILWSVLPWEWALATFAALVPATLFTQDTFRMIRMLVSDIRLLCAPELRRRIKEFYNCFSMEN